MSVPTASKGSVSRIVDLVRVLGAKTTLSDIDAIGGMTIFMVRAFSDICKHPHYSPHYPANLYHRLPIAFVIMLIGIFTGMVLGLQGLLHTRAVWFNGAARLCRLTFPDP